MHIRLVTLLIMICFKKKWFINIFIFFITFIYEITINCKSKFHLNFIYKPHLNLYSQIKSSVRYYRARLYIHKQVSVHNTPSYALSNGRSENANGERFVWNHSFRDFFPWGTTKHGSERWFSSTIFFQQKRPFFYT